MTHLFVFIMALLVELSGALYTIAISHGNESEAVLMSIINSALGLITMYVAIENSAYFPVVILGDVVGTFLAIRLAKRGIKPRKRKFQGNRALWEPTNRAGRWKLRVPKHKN